MVFNSKEICEFLINDMKMFHGKGKCQHITIPQEIYKNWNLAKHAIRGIADTDGSIFVSKKPGIEKYPSIEITTTSVNLANQLKEILIKIGFRITLREGKRKQPRGLIPYRIGLYGKRNLKKWMEEI
ncbi:MAG: LAGLIDADG family homing endonuclease, partial [archaeon]